MSITPYYPSLDIKSREAIQSTVADRRISKEITDIKRLYHTINVAEAMSNLTQVGKLLQVAYAGSKGLPCSSKTVVLVSNYQGLIKNSYAASTTFVEASLDALKQHKFALLLAEKGVGDKAIGFIQRTAEIAQKMATVSEQLVKESQSLCDTSTAALESVVKDEVTTRQEKDRVLKLISDLQAKEASLKQKTTDLAEAIEEEKQRERRAERESKEARDRAYQGHMLSAIVDACASVASAFLGSRPEARASRMAQGITQQASDPNLTQQMAALSSERQKANISLEEAKRKLAVKEKELELEKDESKKNKIRLEMTGLQSDVKSKTTFASKAEAALKKVEDSLTEEAKRAQSKEEQIAKMRAGMQKDLRNANADLAESMVKLRNANVGKEDLAKTIASLEAAIKALGKVKTVFENTRLFWKGVQSHCEKLTDIRTIKDLEELISIDDNFKQQFIKEINESALSWIALADINRIAAISMESVNKHIDGVMTNLPSKEDSPRLINELTQALELYAKEENKLIDQDIAKQAKG